MTAAHAATATVGNGLTTTDLAAPAMTPELLAATLVGAGVSVSNVTYSGAPAQAGLIHLVDPAVVSFNDGVIMSSGNIADVVGPNKSDGITGDMAGPADPDLDALIADSQTVNPVTFDAATLEFDFVPDASELYFTYTFGSDEYLEWVNLFNDVFAFYVNGQNCATVPGGQPVSIDTINDAVNPALFRDNSYSAPPANPINIESDGLSVELICTAPVVAGQTNHMKLAIADTSDQILDSVVMIKAQSLSTIPPESCNDHVDNDDDGLVDMGDDSCSSTTTPPPPGSEGIGSDGSPPPFTGNEGTPIPLDAAALGWTASPDTVSTSWTVTGINGTPGTCDVTPAGPLPLAADGSIAVVSAICPNEGEYVARVDGWDVEGKGSFDTDVDFFVHNAPPAVTLDLPAPGAAATVGVPVAASATVVDPGVTDTYSCEISWGDGATSAGIVSGTTCSGSHTYSEAGPQIISVTATDDAGASAAAATVVTLSVAETVLASSANPSVSGQPVTFTGTTTLGTTGTMSFYDGTTLLATRTVVGGSASYTTSKLAIGNHSVTAAYKRTAASTPSVTPPVTQAVQPAPTAVTLTSTANPSVFGQRVTIKAAVTTAPPGTGIPTGTVDLYDNGTYVATKTLMSGKASFALKPTVGLHAFTASYSGSATHLASTSTALDQTVLRASTTVTLTTPYPTTTLGHGGNITAVVRAVAPGAGVPTGTVDFFVDGVHALTAPVASGRAKLPIASLERGVHSITATYSGDGNFAPSSTTTALTQTIL